jgi:hypothetical protein
VQRLGGYNQIIETNNDAFYYVINLEFWSKAVVEDTAMMVITEPNFTRPLFRCNEGAVQFGSVTTKYPIYDNDWLMGVLIL